MKLILKLFIVVLYGNAIFSYASSAENSLAFLNVSKKLALTHSIVNSMVKGDEGHIWLGSQYGLLRFDGYKIKTYLHDADDSNSIISNVIYSLAKDSNGRIWVATLEGLSRYDPKQDTFTNFSYKPGQPQGLIENKVVSLFVDSQNRVWLSNWSKGLSLYNQDTQSFTHFSHQQNEPNSLASNNIRGVKEDKNGFIWVASRSKNKTKTGLHRLDPSNNSIQRYENMNPEQAFFWDTTNLHYASNNHLYVSAKNGGLVDVNLDDNTAKAIKVGAGKEVIITSIAETQKQLLWLGTLSNGLFQYDIRNRQIANFKHQQNDHSLSGDRVGALLYESNQLWIANGSHGISSLNLMSLTFERLIHDENSNNGIGPNPIFLGLSEGVNGQIWVSNMNQGLIQWQSGPDQNKAIEMLSKQHSLPKAKPQSLLVDSSGDIWIGTQNSGLFQYNSITQTSTHYSPEETGNRKLSGKSVRAIIEYPQGKIWAVINGQGLTAIDIKSKAVTDFKADTSGALKTNYTLNSLFVDSTGIFWLGTTSAGALEIDITTSSVRRHKKSSGSDGISNNYVTGFAETANGSIWLSSDSGLNRIIRKNEKVSYLQLKRENTFFKGAPISALQIDHQDNIWFSYQTHLARYSPKSKELRKFDVYSGSLPGSYVDGTSYKDSRGKLYFGGIGGLIAFTPGDINTLLDNPRLILDDLFINNQVVLAGASSLLKRALPYSSNITLNHKQSHFGLSFSTDQTTATDAIRYRYRLLGYDEQWIETDSENRRAVYTNLDAGEYNFQAQASNNGLWHSPITELQLTLLPAPWLSWWAYTLYLLFSFIIVGSFLWQRYKMYQAMKLKSEAIAQRNKQLSLTATLFQNTSEGVWLADNNFHYLAINTGFKEITGYEENEVKGQAVCISGPQDNGENFGRTLLSRVKNSKRWQGEVWNTRKNGEFYPMEIVIDKITITDEQSDNIEEQYVGVFSDITERRRAEEELRKMAFFDSLTQLPNRNQFQALVQSNISLCQADGKGEFLIMFIDLDNFKNINDSLGHSPGDEVLVYIANKLEKHVKKPMMAARLGGDEYAILVPSQAIGYNTLEFATDYLEKVLKLLRDNFVAESFQFNITASIGVAIYPSDGDNYADLSRSADTAMYEAKSKGRDQGQFYAQDMNQRAMQRLAYENELSNAIASDEIQPYFQAKANFKTGAIEGLEVLARWNSKKLGWVSPEVFIALAEETRRIDQLSEKLLKHSCLTILPIIQRQKFSGRMAFNLSAAQFNDKSLLMKIDNILQECAFPAEYLELEVTESLMMSDPDNAVKTLTRLRDKGISIALDDFGTGYSSLSHLKQLPLDVLKIDRSFIIDIAKNSRDRSMVSSIINLSHDLNLKVVAEGVEEQDQIMLLKDMGCDILQGYCLSKPLCDIDYLEFIAKSHNLYSAERSTAES